METNYTSCVGRTKPLKTCRLANHRRRRSRRWQTSRLLTKQWPLSFLMKSKSASQWKTSSLLLQKDWVFFLLSFFLIFFFLYFFLSLFKTNIKVIPNAFLEKYYRKHPIATLFGKPIVSERKFMLQCGLLGRRNNSWFIEQRSAESPPH